MCKRLIQQDTRVAAPWQPVVATTETIFSLFFGVQSVSCCLVFLHTHTHVFVYDE